MNLAGGIALVVLITLLAGVIAYLGDRVGHQIGRKRLTLFGLRPKYTSTIVAVGTGMVIALAVTVSALVASSYVRQAFFHLSEINTQVQALQAQADALERNAHEQNVVINRGALLYDQFLLLRSQQSQAERARLFNSFFDAVAQHLNQTYVPPLKRFTQRSSDPESQKKLGDFLNGTMMQANLALDPVLVIAVADENLFPNDPIHFGYAIFRDRKVYSAGETIASVKEPGGTPFNAQRVALTQLAVISGQAAIAKGVPPYYAQATPVQSEAQVRQITDQIMHGRGSYQVTARAAIDVYPHTGALPVEFVLSKL